jgi:glutathione-regulated potassium-efflux system ancillary protein KefG
MERILVLFAHPRFEKSRMNRALLGSIEDMAEVTLHDLYEEYPDFNVDTGREQSLLLEHQVIIWHHPFYMYGVPALLKQWIDLVLEYGWAHGKDGDNLKGKLIFNALTAGGTRDVYSEGSHNGFTVRTFLAPFEQTARLCKMVYLPPFVVHGTHLLTDKEVGVYRGLYRLLLQRLVQGECRPETIGRYDYLNDWLLADGRVLPL